ncbi:DMT family transporter [Neoroseomonas lacus]|uniref:DMT transporter permease n=1 Tax=Neoroseomonas lacus TaxID=287609 RepID=A0A917KVR5_9PROT|nr:DMT family transporter [Neoroseomonas lacus]GGJ30476.1 DMT transporter permease [Neoroseomonas lacus]
MSPGTLGLAGLFVLVWASAFNAARIVAQEWPPLMALSLRFAIGVPILLAIAWYARARLPARADLPRIAAMGAFGMGGYLGCAWAASALIPSGLVALLSATAPLCVALGERLLFGRHLTVRAWAGLALGWVGVAMLGLPRAAGGLTDAASLGIAVALAGAVFQAGGLLAFAPARGRLDPLTSNLGQTIVAAMVVAPFSLALESVPVAAPGWLGVAALAWSILVVGLGGYALYFTLLRRLPASSAAALQLLAPPVAALIGWALLGETLRLSDVAGGMVTLGGLAMLLRAPRSG